MRCCVVDCFGEEVDKSVKYMPGVGVVGLCSSHNSLPAAEKAELMVDAERVRKTDAAALDAIEAFCRQVFDPRSA